jgi:phage terminase large subunit
MSAVEFKYKPRKAFLPFHQRSQRYALMVVHRRGGKTVACINELVLRALYTKKTHARYAYVAPYRQQAKEIAWTYLKEATKDIIVGNPRESELRVKLPNDVWITLYGADNPDALRGLYFDGIILDEFGDMKPSLLAEVVTPCLADRQGWLAIIGTAKGRNQFYEYCKKAKNSPEWYYMVLKASQSGIIPEKELQNLREIMTEAQFEQEMECSFEAALLGTFYADALNEIKKNGHYIQESLYEPDQKVHVAADVGLRDSTAWWFWQPRPDGIAIIDHHEASGKHVDYYLGMLHEKGYDYHALWLPSDAKAKTLSTRRSTVEQFQKPSLVRPDLYSEADRLPIRIVPRLGIQHGIDAARLILPTCYFDEKKCEQGLDALRSYRRQFHEHTNSFSDTPIHDWASNSADAFRYMALVANKSVAMPVETPRLTQLPESSRMGQKPVVNQVGYKLDDLWKERDNAHSRLRPIRI